MKEYVAESGGRYTYADDVLSLQELALSMTALFTECPDFILAGCEIEGSKIAPGYLWLGGKIRHYEGCTGATFPFFLCEHNIAESVTYAKQVNKRGRINYGVTGRTTIPQIVDTVTGVLPHFIEVTRDYAPRLKDKFFGRYALLREPLGSQGVSKDLSLSGVLSVDREIVSQEAVAVTVNGYTLRERVKTDGNASIGLYHGTALLGEFLLDTDGGLNFMAGGKEMMRVNDEGFTCVDINCRAVHAGSLSMSLDGILNIAQDDDKGAVKVNYEGFNRGVSRYRNFEVFDGKRCTVPLLKIEGATRRTILGGTLRLEHVSQGIDLVHPYLKNDPRLTGMLRWLDSNEETFAAVGFTSAESFDFEVTNSLGDIVIRPKDAIDIKGTLRVNGADIAAIYATQQSLTEGLAGKVDALAGKGLSSEDFTTELRNKLDAITTGSIPSKSMGYVTAADVSQALDMKLDKSANLSDVHDADAARNNLAVYSKGETNNLYFKVSELLGEVAALTPEEVEGRTPEEIIALKEQKQQTARDHLDAEKKGAVELRLAKAQNLADLPDRPRARQNLEVYSMEEIDRLLAGKLGSDAAYSGVPFTEDHKAKLEGIKTGSFAGINADGESVSQVEGYVMTSAVKKELDKKAGRLLEGYSAADKAAIAENIDVYSKRDSDDRYGKLASALQDYITYQVRQGQTTTQAQQTLRDKLNAAGKGDLGDYMRRDGKLSDLLIATDSERQQICQRLGAAYAPEYQQKLEDTGWISCGGSNAGTLFARQIGNIVCIQGTINTARRTNATWGECATIPNQISPPKYGCRQTAADFNDDHVYNRGCSFRIQAGSREIQIHERGMYNVQTELFFSYMT